MKQTLLLSALALAGLANAQAPARMEMPQMNNAVVKADFAQTSVMNCKSLDLNRASLVAPGKSVLTAPVASYADPVNLMIIGLSSDWNGLQKTSALYPAFQSVTWKNTSEGATAFSWEYADPNSQFDWNTGTSSATMFAETADLVAPAYPMGYFSTPVMTASDATGASVDYRTSAVQMQVGATMDETDPQTGNIVRLWGAGLYDMAGLMKYMPLKQAGLYSTDVFGFGSTFDTTWKQVVTGNNLGTSASLIGAGAIVEKPEAPYMLSYIYAFVNKEVQANNFMDPASKLKIAIYPLSDQGVIMPEVLATGTCMGSDISADGTAIFFLERQEGELIEAVDLTVASGLYIEMSLESANPKDNVSLLTLLAGDGLMKEHEALVHLNIDGQDKFLSASALGFNNGLRARGYSFHLGVTYNWLFERNGKNTYDSVGPDGGVVSFNMNSLYNMEAMATVDGEGQFDWWEVSYGKYDVQTGNQDMIFSFQPLPAGVDDRRCVACVSTPGVGDQYFYISQLRNGGVESVVASTSSAQFVDGNFVVSSTVADAVNVYNVSGQLVASAAVNGSAVIPAADLANGLYIVKFNDNTVVKVMK